MLESHHEEIHEPHHGNCLQGQDIPYSRKYHCYFLTKNHLITRIDYFAAGICPPLWKREGRRGPWTWAQIAGRTLNAVRERKGGDGNLTTKPVSTINTVWARRRGGGNQARTAWMTFNTVQKGDGARDTSINSKEDTPYRRERVGRTRPSVTNSIDDS